MFVSTKNQRLFCLLLIASVLAIWAALEQSTVHHALLPKSQSVYPWRAWVNAGSHQGPSASIDLRESTYHLSIDMKLESASHYPWANLGVTFDDETNPERLVDMTIYQSILFRIKCRPANVLTFSLYTYAEKITQIPDITSYRLSETFISCIDEWRDIRINLNGLSTPAWWLSQHRLNLADQQYQLDKVRGLSIISSPESPRDTLAGVTIESIIFEGRDFFWVYLTAVILIFLWSGFVYRTVYLWTAKQPDSPAPSTISYEPIIVEPRHERDKAAVLAYLAREYSNPDLNVDTLVSSTGVNRTKINNILRDETGLTFTGYLNKIRLSEAARLLADERMGVAEAAFAVGYSSLSYFNRVFKKAYGLPPSLYKRPPDNKNQI